MVRLQYSVDNFGTILPTLQKLPSPAPSWNLYLCDRMANCRLVIRLPCPNFVSELQENYFPMNSPLHLFLHSQRTSNENATTSSVSGTPENTAEEEENGLQGMQCQAPLTEVGGSPLKRPSCH